MYNAYKHGLAILPSPAFTMSIGHPEKGQSVTMEGGRGYQYLELTRSTQPRGWRWQRTQEHVDFEARAAEVSVLLLVLDSILATGATARRITESGNCHLLPPEVSPRICASEIRSPCFVSSFSEGLSYYKEARQQPTPPTDGPE
jgi:hypothetical protein